MDKAYQILSKRPAGKVSIPILSGTSVDVDVSFPPITCDDEWTAVTYVSKNKDDYVKHVDAKAEEYATELYSLDATPENGTKLVGWTREILAATACVVLKEQEQKFIDLGYKLYDLSLEDLPEGAVAPKTAYFASAKTPSWSKFSKSVSTFGRRLDRYANEDDRSEPPPGMYV